MSWKLRGKSASGGRLYTGPLYFNTITWDSKARGFLMSWIAQTEVPNRFFVRLVVIGLQWPPVRWLSGFMSDDEDSE